MRTEASWLAQLTIQVKPAAPLEPAPSKQRRDPVMPLANSDGLRGVAASIPVYESSGRGANAREAFIQISDFPLFFLGMQVAPHNKGWHSGVVIACEHMQTGVCDPALA